MQRNLTLYTSGVLLLTGCALPLPDPVDTKTATWVERDVVSHRAGMKTDRTKTLVIAEQMATTPDPRDRVIWQKKLPTVNQYTSERNGVEAVIKLDTEVRAKAYLFETQGAQLSAAGKMVMNQFKDDGVSRYFVEIFSSEEMSEKVATDSNAAYRAVIEQLKNKGLDPKRVILGGTSYKQSKNGIVLLTVKTHDR